MSLGFVVSLGYCIRALILALIWRPLELCHKSRIGTYGIEGWIILIFHFTWKVCNYYNIGRLMDPSIDFWFSYKE